MARRLYFAIPCSSVYASKGENLEAAFGFSATLYLHPVHIEAFYFLAYYFLFYRFLLFFSKCVYLDLYNPAEEQGLGSWHSVGKGMGWRMEKDTSHGLELGPVLQLPDSLSQIHDVG